MRSLNKVDWLVFIGAAPVVCAVGYLAGLLGCLAFFKVTGTGTSHNDAFYLFSIAMLGGVCGFVGGPILVWRRWRRQSPF
jgi:hypothetical protein